MPRPVPPGVHPRNYVELADEIDWAADAEDPFRSSRAEAWSTFTHLFFSFKSDEFFAVPPPDAVPPKEQALWSAIAESFCRRMDLPVPAWTENPRYFLSTPFDPYLIRAVASERSIEERLADADEEFRRSNIAANSRDFLSA